MSNGVELLASATAFGSRLMRIQYRIQNNTTETIYAFVRAIIGQEATRRPYTVLKFDPDCLLATYRRPSPPRLMMVFRGILPLSAKVRPGSAFRDIAEFEIPVEEIQPFLTPEYPEDPEVLYVNRLSFETEWLNESEAYFVRPHPKEDGLFAANGPLHRLETTLELPDAIPVLRRDDDYYRL